LGPGCSNNQLAELDLSIVPSLKKLYCKSNQLTELGISQIGIPGFCALKLAQRLLDPAPAGNCKLQTLRQYYRLPENGAPGAQGKVLTLIDLMRQVLRPLAEKRKTYERLTQAINEARDRGDIELLERIAKDPQAFILKQG
jgi:Leucine-rich repeat (LRR) protein